MFDTFTRQLYRAEGRNDLADALSIVPRATLQKLAFGELECGEGHRTWLEKFKGTALFDKALELMQAELEQEAQEMQNRQQSQQFYSASDQIRLKKKLLELELARTEMGQLAEAGPIEQEAPSATAPAQGAATQASITPEPGAPPKTAAARKFAAMGSPVHPANLTGIGSSIMGALSTAPKAVINAGSKPVVNNAGAQLAHRMSGATAPRAASTGMNITNAPGGLRSLADLNSRKPPMSVASLMEKKNSAPIALLREMAKQAGIGQAAMDFVKKNPGLAAGAVGGMAVGGVRGAQEKIDPLTGQAVGGGITGALGGALTHGTAGGVLGLGAQGAIRSGLGAKRATEAWGKKGLTAPGGFTGQLAQQAGARIGGFAQDVSHLGGAAGDSLRGFVDFRRGNTMGAAKGLRTLQPPTKLPTVAPAAVEDAAKVVAGV